MPHPLNELGHADARRTEPSSLGVDVAWTGRLCLGLCGAAHWLCAHHMSLVGRLVHVVSRMATGADIDPMASVSSGAIIPHPTGVVIGSTAVVEKGAVVMPNVVLGAGNSHAAARRHPHIGSGALVGAGAVVLGPVTVGEGARVGANAVVLEDVSPGATVVGVPAREVRRL